MKESTTDLILDASRQEFLQRGFKDASLRRIAASAGVSTGAIYANYSNKASLFTALVEPEGENFMAQFICAQREFTQMPESEQINLMFSYSDTALYSMLEQIYENFEIFRLIICCSEGTEYADYLHNMIEIECKGTRRFMSMLSRNGFEVVGMPGNLVHILNGAYLTSIFETVRHNMPKDEAFAYIKSLVSFFNAGWREVLGVS